MNQKFGLGIPEQPAASPELMDALRQLKCSRLLPDIGKLIDEATDAQLEMRVLFPDLLTRAK